MFMTSINIISNGNFPIDTISILHIKFSLSRMDQTNMVDPTNLSSVVNRLYTSEKLRKCFLRLRLKIYSQTINSKYEII